ncbi:MAG: LPS-assembly protein LptD [Armatimonadetes bacterium]|nr:LPS-assembly protein LptD [Armatimonadota bacterium]
MRPLPAAILMALPCAALAQSGGTGLATEVGKALGAKPRPGNPLDPKGTPGLPERDSSLPEPQADVNVFQLVQADRWKRVGDQIVLDGGVQCHYKGYDLFADHIEGDLVTNVFTLTGSARLVGKDGIVRGDIITADLDAKTFRAGKAAAQLRPDLLQGRVVDDVYIWGAETYGDPKTIHTHDGGLTTCNLDHPHYTIDSKDITIRTGKRIILRNSKFVVLGRTLFRIPYLAIPLDTKRERYTPQIGSDPTTGFFIKNRIGIPIRGNNSLDADLDYYSKLGFGIGGIFGYAGSAYDGYLRAYGILGDTNTVELRSQHNQDFGSGAQFTMSNNYQQRNQFNAPQNTSLNTQASLTLPRGGQGQARGQNTTRLTLIRNSNESPSFFSKNQVWGLYDQERWGKTTSATLNLKWATYESGSSNGTPVHREQVDVQVRAQQETSKGQAELEYSRSIPVGEVANFFSAQDRTPVLSFRTDSRKLLGEDAKPWLPFTAEMSLGEYADPGSRGKITRSFFDFSANRAMQSGKGFGFGLQGRFRQGIYSDDTAQFALQVNPTLRYGFSNDTGLNIRYNYLRAHGYSPLSQDRVGETNLATADLSVRALPTLKLGVQTGYDLLASERPGVLSAWQQLGIRTEWTPNDAFQLRAWPVYDTANRRWGNVRLDADYGYGDLYLSVGARYDSPRHTWGTVNFRADGLTFGKTRLSVQGAFNGYLNKWESIWYSASYDLHCWEAVLQVADNKTGFRAGQQIFFGVRLKAFPFDTSFGTGTRGQPIGTGTGMGY